VVISPEVYKIMTTASVDNSVTRLPFWYMVARQISSLILAAFSQSKLLGAANIPTCGPCLIVVECDAWSDLIFLPLEIRDPLHFVVPGENNGALQLAMRALKLINITTVPEIFGAESRLVLDRVIRGRGYAVAAITRECGALDMPGAAASWVGGIAYELRCRVLPVKIVTVKSPYARRKVVIKAGSVCHFTSAVPGLSQRDKYEMVGRSIAEAVSRIHLSV